MPWIFGRETQEPHAALGIAAAELSRAGNEPSHRMLAWNLLHDDRVSEQRAAEFFRLTGFPSKPDQVIPALNKYSDHLDAAAPEATYLAPSNANNIIPKSWRPKFALAHVLNLSKVLWSIPHQTPEGVAKTKDRLLSITDRKPVLEDLLHQAFELQCNRPTWAADWSRLSKYSDFVAPDHWNRAVGVWRFRESIQIVLRYEPSRVTQFVRPTQLDAGAYQFHFPSPAGRSPKRGGVAMLLQDLETPPRRRLPLVPEYLHAPIRFSFDDWLKAEELLAAVDDGPSPETIAFRRRHWELLTEAKSPVGPKPEI